MGTRAFAVCQGWEQHDLAFIGLLLIYCVILSKLFYLWKPPFLICEIDCTESPVRFSRPQQYALF